MSTFEQEKSKKDKYLQNLELLKDGRVQSLLRVIRSAEGTSGDRGYNTRVGNTYFNDLTKKPGVKTYIKSIGQNSSAEGAYQFLNDTWEGVSNELGLKDFSPTSQDIAAIELIKKRGALDNILNNDFEGAIGKLSKEWASLPTSETGKGFYTNQKARKLSDLKNIYSYNLGEGIDYTKKYEAPPEYDLGDKPTMQGSPMSLDKSTTQVEEEPEEVADAKESINDKSFIQDLYNTVAQQQQQLQQIQDQQKGQEPTKEEQIQEQYSSDDMKDPYNYIDLSAEDTSQYRQPEFQDQQQFQTGGFKLKDERNLVQRDNIPNTKRDLSLMLSEYDNTNKDKEELTTTGKIKNPRSIQYRRNIKPQVEVKQDNISTEQRNAQLSPLERPLIYLANPSKVLGDLGVPNMETSELDRQAIAANRFNPNQTRFQRLENQAKLGLGYVPEATVNTAMAATFIPEGSGALGLLNETLNPLAGLKTSIPDELRQGLRAQGFSFSPKFSIKDDHFYRSIGVNGAEDALSSGSIRSKKVGDYAGKNPYFVEGADFERLHSTGAGATSNKPEYIFEMPMVDKSGEVMTANRVNQNSGYAPYIADKNQIPLSEGSIYKLNNKGEYEVFNTPQLKQGGIINSNRGQWDFPGEDTRVFSDTITMGPDPIDGKKLTQPLLGVDNLGNKQMMYPGEDYKFPGAEYVTEYPQFQVGGFKLKDERSDTLMSKETIPNFKPKLPVQLKKSPVNVPTIDTLMKMRPDLTKDQGIFYGTGDDTTYVSPGGKLPEVVVKAWKKPSNMVDLNNVKSKDDAIALQKKLVDSGYDLGQYGTNKDGIDGQIGNVTKNALKSYNEITKYQEEYNKGPKRQRVENFIIDKLGKRDYNKRELEIFRDSDYLVKRPELIDEDVKQQVELNRKSGNIDSNYVVISDKNSRGYVFDKDSKLVKSFKNITGKDTGENTKINSKTWVAENPGKNFTDYVDYLEKTSQKYTPSGVYFVGKKDEDYSGLKSNSIFGKALIQGREILGSLGLSDTNEKRRAIREHSYGNVGLIGLKRLSGTGIGEAMHSTGTPERTENLTGLSTTKNRKMSSGCINVGNEDMQYCMDNLGHNTPIFLLREDGKQLSPSVLKYKNASKPEREVANGLYNNYEKLKEDFGPETDNYINYSTGILGNESSWDNMSMKGEVKEAAAKNTFIRGLLGKKGDASVGAAQIKWSGISPETRTKLKKFGINSESDLEDTNKSAIAAMYFLKDKVSNKGGNLEEGIKSYLGTKGNSSKVRHYIRKVTD